MGKYLHEKLMQALGSHKNVGEIRHIGLIHAIELVEDPKTKKAFGSFAPYWLAYFQKGHGSGACASPDGDIIYFNPPLYITREDLDRGVSLCKEAVEACWGSRDWWLVTSD